MTEPVLLDIPAVAAMVGVNPETIRRSINATKPSGMVRPFPGWKLLGRKRVTTRDNVIQWLEGLPNA